MMEERNPGTEPGRTYRRPEPLKDDKLKLRNILNIVFIALVIIAIVIYFVMPMPKGSLYFYACCLVAIIVKCTEVTIRMAFNHKKRRK